MAADGVTVAAVVNDVVIFDVDKNVKDEVMNVTVKFTSRDKDKPEIVTEAFVKSWVRIPATVVEYQEGSALTVQVCH